MNDLFYRWTETPEEDLRRGTSRHFIDAIFFDETIGDDRLREIGETVYFQDVNRALEVVEVNEKTNLASCQLDGLAGLTCPYDTEEIDEMNDSEIFASAPTVGWGGWGTTLAIYEGEWVEELYDGLVFRPLRLVRVVKGGSQ